MKRANELNFLKWLHALESEFGVNILTQNEKELVARVREAFLKEVRSAF